VTALVPAEGSPTAFGLEFGLKEVEVQAVDGLDFEGHMWTEDIGNGSRHTQG
jgi:hypothetical protein